MPCILAFGSVIVKVTVSIANPPSFIWLCGEGILYVKPKPVGATQDIVDKFS